MLKKVQFVLPIVILFLVSPSLKASKQIWKINDNGGISWVIKDNIPHFDHIEMSGKRVSVVLRYGINSRGGFDINKSMVWPLLRTIPNNTHASLMRRFDWSPLNTITVNGLSFRDEKVQKITLKGKLIVESEIDNGWRGKFSLKRVYFPSTDKPVLCEKYTITNTGKRPIYIEFPKENTVVLTDEKQGVEGVYRIYFNIDKAGSFWVKPNESISFNADIAAYKNQEQKKNYNIEEEETKRDNLVDFWMNNLVLETPDKVIDKMFAFSKIRACESIYETKGGSMHGPGGESYYAAIWANDQAEYINPYFPFTGYEYGNASALNSFMHFARFMNPEFKPIPSSIIAEGLDIWNGAGDRGDAAMIAYGASRYALARGKKQEAKQLWPLISWCLDYCKSKMNTDGVVMSDTDELENRFESGDANLCTSSLYYDALLSAAYLANEIGEKGSRKYKKQAKKLKQNIEKYFGHNVEGFDTYAYYKGNNILRSWICIPLTVGIIDRADATIDALFSPRLWTEDGLLTQAGSKTFWDRSTLYALRGVYEAGETKKATKFLHKYSAKRLLGNHVPYAIEAWPEGEQRHLSAESGLYGRIITEGLFGIRPTGLNSFSITPRLPKKWNKMALRKIHAFGKIFDIEINRKNNGNIQITFSNNQKQKVAELNENATYLFNFNQLIP